MVASTTPGRVLITTAPFGQHGGDALDRLRAHGIEFTLNTVGRRLKELELADLIRDVDVLIAGTEAITAHLMDRAPRLRLISRVGIGLDSVDLLAARDRGIQVSYTPDAPSPAVAELTLGLMLALLRQIPAADRSLRAGDWRRLMGRRLEGLTVGLIGVGRVGRRVARMIRAAFPSTRLLGHDIAPDGAVGTECALEWVDAPRIFAESDIVSVHVPLTALTIDFVSDRELALMRPTACLINTARGEIVNERALARALREGRLHGAAIDVFAEEPYHGELASLDNVILTCHMGSMSEDCRAQMEIEATDEAVRFLTGLPLLRPVPDAEYLIAAQRQTRR